MTITFKPGDRVRTKGTSVYPYGTEFTVTEWMPAGWAKGDPRGYGVWGRFLELVPIPPSPDEYRDPRYEALIRTNEDLQATLRKRNEQVEALQAQARKSAPEAGLHTLADQLGLTFVEAAKALETGAWLLATGGSRESVNFWRSVEHSIRRQFHEQEKES